MSGFTISRELIAQLQSLAEQENRSVDDLLRSMLDQYQQRQQGQNDTLRSKLYRKARDYWASVGDQSRLALTDEQLDDQFWLIDHNEIPRLKSDQSTVELPPDPLEGLIGLFSDIDQTDLSSTIRETIDARYRKNDEHTD